MQNENLKILLKEYDQKKLKAELDLEKRKKELYDNNPKLREIEESLQKLAISTAKNILKNPSSSISSFKDQIEFLKKEKENILKKLNINTSYLKPFYECNLCNDTGYVTNKDNTREMCHCLKQKLLNISFNKSNIYNLDKENFNTFDETIFSDDVDISKYKFNISPRSNIKNIKQKCINFVNDFDNPQTKNLFFTGGTGLRKIFYF